MILWAIRQGLLEDKKGMEQMKLRTGAALWESSALGANGLGVDEGPG